MCIRDRSTKARYLKLIIPEGYGNNCPPAAIRELTVYGLEMCIRDRQITIYRKGEQPTPQQEKNKFVITGVVTDSQGELSLIHIFPSPQ